MMYNINEIWSPKYIINNAVVDNKNNSIGVMLEYGWYPPTIIYGRKIISTKGRRGIIPSQMWKTQKGIHILNLSHN